MGVETQITHGPGGRILTNTAVWSPDSRFIVYDTRSDADGTRFDGARIEIVTVETGEIQTVYTAKNGAFCGVPTFHPTENRVVFILGPEYPTPDWQYGPTHRQGVTVDLARPGVAVNLDARDLTPPFTPGALRGGSHVHVYSPDGQWVSFTYNDAVLSRFTQATPTNDIDQRNVGVSSPLPPPPRRLPPSPSEREGGVPGNNPAALRTRNGEDSAPVFCVSQGRHLYRTPPSLSEGEGGRRLGGGGRGELTRNHYGTAFSVLVARTVAAPIPGSDQIQRAFEEGWVGIDGYRRADGSQQKRALAFLGEVISSEGKPVIEVFIVDLPGDLTIAGVDGPLEGTETRRPAPPRGATQRRLTFTTDRTFPGVQGPRHWVRSCPDGSRIAFLMRDDCGEAQLWTVSPNGGVPQQITKDVWGVASAFSWCPKGKRIAYVADNSAFVVEAATGRSRRLTQRSADADAPLPLACIFSPDGRQITYLRHLPENPAADAPRCNQIFVVAPDEIEATC